jgi:hypothetical protein
MGSGIAVANNGVKFYFSIISFLELTGRSKRKRIDIRKYSCSLLVNEHLNTALKSNRLYLHQQFANRVTTGNTYTRRHDKLPMSIDYQEIVVERLDIKKLAVLNELMQ